MFTGGKNMTLNYYEHYERIYRGIYDHGIYIDPRTDYKYYISVSEMDPNHGGSKVVGAFLHLFNPIRISRPSNKENAIENVRDTIKSLSNSKYLSSDKYLILKLYQYFLEVYASEKTKFERYIIELFETTGYNPKFWNNTDRNLYEPERSMFIHDEMDILKSILIQSCDIDSVESQWPRTIQTSKFNIYEYFYNYLLMDWNIQIVPKRVMNKNTQTFVDYKQNPFMISDKEKRLKDEIISIKANYKLEDRIQFFK